MAARSAELNKTNPQKTLNPFEGRFSAREPLFVPAGSPATVPVVAPPKEKEKIVKKSKPKHDDYHPAPVIRKITIQEIKIVAIIIVVLTGISLGSIFISAEAAVLQKEVNDIKTQTAQIEEDMSALRVDIEESKNLHAVVARARDELGMSEPSFDQLVYINELAPIEGSFAEFMRNRSNEKSAEAAAAASNAENSDEGNSEEDYDGDYDENYDEE